MCGGCETPDILSHHADLRPTLLAVLGLTDRYTHDGVVLGDALEPSALPAELADDRETYVYLARAAKTINDPLGQLGRNSLALATQAITGGDVGYQRYLDMMAAITTRRDALTREINTQLDGAAFGHRPINPSYARVLIGRAGALVNEVEDLAGSSLARRSSLEGSKRCALTTELPATPNHRRRAGNRDSACGTLARR